MANANIDYNGIRANQYTYGKQIIVINGHKYYIQCPKTIDSHTTFFMAGRGSGGIGDTKSAFQQANDDNVIIIAPVHQGDGDVLGTVDVIGLLADAYGIEPNASFSGHSNSGTLALRTAQKYIQTYNKPTMLVLNDPYNCASDSSVDYSLFKDSVIVAYAPRGGGCYEGFKDRVQKAAVAGAKVLIVRYSYGGHGASDDIAAANGAFDIDGFTLKNTITYIDSHGGTYTTNLTYEYIDEKGKTHTFGSVEEAQAFLDDSLIGFSQSLYEKCADLKEFAAHYKGKGDTLASNLSFVSNSMSAINSQITEHTDVNYESPAGEAKVIGSLYKASNYYGAVTNVLYGNLSAETEAVYGIANAIYKMDGAASVIAETNLTSGVQAIFNAGNPSVAAALEELKARSGELFDTAKTAVTAGGRYDELRGILSDKPDAGSIGKVSVSSLESAINSIVPNLENEINKATGIRSSVEEFMTGIGSSNILQGETWEAVKTNMGNYSGLLDCNVKAATFISDTIKTAMGLVVDYIQNAAGSIKAVDATEFGNLAALDELDDSKLGELNQAIQTMTDRITEQEEFIKEKEALPDVCDSCLGADGETYEPCNCRRPYSAADMQGWKETLQKYIDIKTDLNTYKGVLEGFAPVVAQAQDIINDAIDQVKTAYENPTTDTKGNQTFNSDFSLDLTKYGIDDSKDYKKLIDDYYAKLNPPKATLDDVLALDEQEPDPAGSNPDSPSSPGGPSGPGVTPPDPTTPTTQAPTEALTEAPTSTSTEPETTPVTEPETVPQTEPDTVPETIPATEPKTDVVVEPETQVPTEPSEQEPTQKKPSGGGTSKKPKNPNVDPLENPSEPIIVDTNEEPIVDEPIISDYIEPAIEAPIEEAPVEIEPVPTETKNTSGLKAMGIASGIGLAVGGAALGAHSIMKSKDDEDTDEDYGYDK